MSTTVSLHNEEIHKRYIRSMNSFKFDSMAHLLWCDCIRRNSCAFHIFTEKRNLMILRFLYLPKMYITNW